MKIRFCRCLAAALLPGASIHLDAQTPATLHERLKVLAPLLGEWNVTWTDEAGQPWRGRLSIVPAAGGTTCTADYQASNPQGQVVFSSHSTYHWQPDTRTVVALVVESDASYGSDTLVREGEGGSVWHGWRRLASGRILQQVMRLSRVNEDSFVVQYTDQMEDGERAGDSPKFTMTRVPATTEQALNDLGAELDGAYMKRDLATLRRLLAEDYVSIDETGEALNKAQDLEIVGSGAYTLKAVRQDEPARVRLLGDTAVVHWAGTVTQEYRGQDRSGRFRTTTVWVKRDGRWQVISWQASKR